MSFDLEKALREVLSDGKETPCIFDRLIEKFDTYSERPASTYIELRQRDDKAMKGLAWEKFCQWYLLTVKKYDKVWLWKEIPEDVKEKLGLTMRNDNGIDIVAQRYNSYTAVQCKYKKRQIAKGRKTVKVSWKTLSTFIGLTSRTNNDNWEQHIVMTNCDGVGKWQIPRTKKDKTIAYGTFKNLSRTECSPNGITIQTEVPETSKKVAKTPEEIRAARLAFYKQ